MRKALLSIMGCLVALMAFAKETIDPKYGVGAVPVDENGTVCFQTEIEIPSSMSADECYLKLMQWAKGRFSMPYAQAGRILNEDAESHRFIFHVDQLLVFKRTAIVADESRIEYNFQAVINNGKITLKMTDIKYRYEEGREGGGSRFTAEDWITDKEAFNAKKTKFLKRTGKFRIKTIDLKDMLFDNAKDFINE